MAKLTFKKDWGGWYRSNVGGYEIADRKNWYTVTKWYPNNGGFRVLGSRCTLAESKALCEKDYNERIK